ncbi:MAG TPA: beta-ketoacyl-ACP synthase II [Pseudomonadota bacterium]|nr:beta-ketoacyl-ACP synthase II [Xanthomonadales bacterium]HQW64556.1 beta-ketoacyl-ACP synthase II [Pseudomonadota bacterium]MBP6691501.1 beta-ketoacyl-ACP synthase II [Xanthomonadales bacterium]MBP7418128.1 beta-ketoacyl-ACP synthase II [Xanthomonadales bacterium]HQX23643.1 beta-ketoacyl-ACP synthase II [Pseudomonadota bacterium]
MSKRRVVVTGLGIISPVGNDIATAWKNVVEGRSGIGPITHFDVSAFATRIAGEVRDFDPTRWIAPKDVKKMDPFIQYGLAAALDAVKDSGLGITEANADRCGAALGAGIGGLGGIEKTTEAYLNGGPRKISPFFVPSTIINMLPGHLAIMLGMKGPNLSAVSACTTATHNIGLAMRLIQYGDADVMVAGGAECSTTPTAIGGFIAARALSSSNDDPTRTSRPWDKDRDGFVLSDGAGVLVLEEYEHAKARGARIYAELAGFGMSDDAFHMTAPPEDGSGAAASMRNAVRDAGVGVDTVEYVNAHATSTPLGDVAETRAIRTCFGAHADRLMVSSTKSVTGHLLGAAGGVEAIFSVLALHDGVIPPTINLDAPGEGCDLDYVPNTARRQPVSTVVSNSFGFGGTNGTLLFRRI